MLWNRLTLCTGGKTFVGARLRRLRGEHGLTQVALARTLGLSTSYVNLLENDQRPVTVAVLLALAERFDLPTHYFTPESDARLVSDLREILADGSGDDRSDRGTGRADARRCAVSRSG
jgi:transcriptional regulator with XRE-family HTH domain